jgi:hypothetical protein
MRGWRARTSAGWVSPIGGHAPPPRLERRRDWSSSWRPAAASAKISTNLAGHPSTLADRGELRRSPPYLRRWSRPLLTAPPRVQLETLVTLAHAELGAAAPERRDARVVVTRLVGSERARSALAEAGLSCGSGRRRVGALGRCLPAAHGDENQRSKPVEARHAARVSGAGLGCTTTARLTASAGRTRGIAAL